MEKKTTIRMSGETKEKAQYLMKYYGLSFSALIRFLINRAFEELNK